MTNEPAAASAAFDVLTVASQDVESMSADRKRAHMDMLESLLNHCGITAESLLEHCMPAMKHS